jgi:hypothetical protein
VQPTAGTLAPACSPLAARFSQLSQIVTHFKHSFSLCLLIFGVTSNNGLAKRRNTLLRLIITTALLKWLLVLCTVALWVFLYLVEVDTLF